MKAAREAKEDSFRLEFEPGLFITADRYQYVLHQGMRLSYFTEITSLLKYMIASQLRQSPVASVQQIVDKISEIHKLIDTKFGNYDPANIKALLDNEVEEVQQN